MTFSIAAWDRQTGDLGVAVASKFLAVGAVVPWVEAEVGAVATQALANVAYGPDGLARLRARQRSSPHSPRPTTGLGTASSVSSMPRVQQ